MVPLQLHVWQGANYALDTHFPVPSELPLSVVKGSSAYRDPLLTALPDVRATNGSDWGLDRLGRVGDF